MIPCPHFSIFLVVPLTGNLGCVSGMRLWFRFCGFGREMVFGPIGRIMVGRHTTVFAEVVCEVFANEGLELLHVHAPSSATFEFRSRAIVANCRTNCDFARGCSSPRVFCALQTRMDLLLPAISTSSGEKSLPTRQCSIFFPSRFIPIKCIDRVCVVMFSESLVDAQCLSNVCSCM